MHSFVMRGEMSLQIKIDYPETFPDALQTLKL
jgi:hypothetical protein